MNTPSDAPRRYRIVFRGECGGTLAGVLGNATVESRHGYTCAVAAVRDESEFYGLLDRLQDLALSPVSLSELGRGPACDRTALVLAEGQAADAGTAALDPRSHALIRLAGLAAYGAAPAVLREQVVAALGCGVSPQEVTATVEALLPAVGADRLVEAATAIWQVLDEVAGIGLTQPG